MCQPRRHWSHKSIVLIHFFYPHTKHRRPFSTTTRTVPSMGIWHGTEFLECSRHSVPSLPSNNNKLLGNTSYTRKTASRLDIQCRRRLTLVINIIPLSEFPQQRSISTIVNVCITQCVTVLGNGQIFYGHRHGPLKGFSLLLQSPAQTFRSSMSTKWVSFSWINSEI